MTKSRRAADANSIEIALADGVDTDQMMRRAYEGALGLYAPRPTAVALCDWARSLIEEAFHPLSPQTAQHEVDVDRFVEIVAPLKPRFIHHPKTKRLMKEYLTDLGYDPARTYLDVPRMRVVSSDNYLQAGVGHKQPPHRDTWWSAPFQQIQFWTPIFPMSRESSMEFYPHYCGVGVPNTSPDFNLYRWNADGRKNAAQHRAGEDTRGIPQPLAPLEYPGACQIVLPVGGSVLFSANQLHATTDNTSGRTRFSIDFRIVDVEHVRDGVGAENLDASCQGIALRDFHRVEDDADFPSELVARYDSGEIDADAVLVFKPA